ncbi:MAG: S-layer homology domain-containing protein [Eubacterium sp.]|nr:S-layer homology domain-containing protein [Eubacterium sp.]
MKEKGRKKVLHFVIAVMLMLMTGCLFGVTSYAEGETITITPENIGDYFENQSGLINPKNISEGAEVIFKGDFSESAFIGTSGMFFLSAPIIIKGEDAVFRNVQFFIGGNDISVSGLKITNEGLAAFWITEGSDIDISDNKIYYTANSKSGIALYSNGSKRVSITDNYIKVGTSDGDESSMYYPLNISQTDDVIISRNEFDFEIPSLSVDWEITSDGYKPVPKSEGIHLEDCNRITFNDNIYRLKYSQSYGSYDTLYGVSITGNTATSFDDDYDIKITGNDIEISGHSYAYGFIIESPDYYMVGNTIKVFSDNNYAAAVDSGGNGSRISIFNNTFTAEGPVFAYGLYGEFYDNDIRRLYVRNNIINATGDVAVGVEFLGSRTPNGTSISENKMNMEGKLTYGITADLPGTYVMTSNEINVKGTNEQVSGIDEHFYSFCGTSCGIVIKKGQSTAFSAFDNRIETTGTGIKSEANGIIHGNKIIADEAYPVDLDSGVKNENNNVTVNNNLLKSRLFEGDDGVKCTEWDIVYNNYGQEVWPFNDVKEGSTGSDLLIRAYDLGIVNGVTKPDVRNQVKYKPKADVTRAQFAIMLYNMARCDGYLEQHSYGKTAYSDLNVGDTGYKEVMWASGNRIINGFSDGTFKPNEPITRAQIALLITRYAQFIGKTPSGTNPFYVYVDYKDVQKNFINSVEWTLNHGIITGIKKGDKYYIMPNGNASRLQCAMIIMRYYDLIRD